MYIQDIEQTHESTTKRKYQKSNNRSKRCVIGQMTLTNQTKEMIFLSSTLTYQLMPKHSCNSMIQTPSQKPHHTKDLNYNSMRNINPP